MPLPATVLSGSSPKTDDGPVPVALEVGIRREAAEWNRFRRSPGGSAVAAAVAVTVVLAEDVVDDDVVRPWVEP